MKTLLIKEDCPIDSYQYAKGQFVRFNTDETADALIASGVGELANDADVNFFTTHEDNIA